MAYQPPLPYQPPPPPPGVYQPQLPFGAFQPQLPFGSTPTYPAPFTGLGSTAYQPQLPLGSTAAPTYTPPLTAQQLGFDFRPPNPVTTPKPGTSLVPRTGTSLVPTAGAAETGSFAQRAWAQIKGAGKFSRLGPAIAIPVAAGFAADFVDPEGDQGRWRELGGEVLRLGGIGGGLGMVGGLPGALLGAGLGTAAAVWGTNLGLVGGDSSPQRVSGDVVSEAPNRDTNRDTNHLNLIVNAANQVGILGDDGLAQEDDPYVSERIFEYFDMVDSGMKPKKALESTVVAIAAEGQRRADTENSLAAQAMAAEFLGPLTENVLAQGQQQAQLQHALADTLPAAYQTWGHAQAEGRITNATNLAAAYTAQLQAMPYQQYLMDQKARQDQIDQMVWQSQLQQQSGSGGGGQPTLPELMATVPAGLTEPSPSTG